MNAPATHPAASTSQSLGNAALVKSAVRVLELFEFARRVQRPFKAVELRNALDWPAASAHMILETLVESGYLVFNNETKQYFPSPRVTTIGHWISDAGSALAGASQVMEEIAAETGQMVALSIENNYSAQCVRVVPGRTPIPIEILEGFRAPLTTSAAGFAILMAKTDGQAITTVQKSRELVPAGTDTYSKVIGKVSQFRREGRALVYGRLWPESCWVSVPTPRPYNCVSATISAGGSIATMRRREDAVTSIMIAAINRWKSRSGSGALQRGADATERDEPFDCDEPLCSLQAGRNSGRRRGESPRGRC
jgi:DNA-binding IclR family transcriptional regulator